MHEVIHEEARNKDTLLGLSIITRYQLLAQIPIFILLELTKCHFQV